MLTGWWHGSAHLSGNVLVCGRVWAASRCRTVLWPQCFSSSAGWAACWSARSQNSARPWISARKGRMMVFVKDRIEYRHVQKKNAPVKSNFQHNLSSLMKWKCFQIQISDDQHHFCKQIGGEISILTGERNIHWRKDKKCLFTYLKVYNRDMTKDSGEMIYIYTTCNTTHPDVTAVCTWPVMSRLSDCYIQHQLHTAKLKLNSFLLPVWRVDVHSMLYLQGEITQTSSATKC